MAASALTTFTPAPANRTVSAAAASVAIAYATMQSRPASERLGRGCILLEGGPVFFDAGRRPDIGALALVVFGCGRLAVVPVPEQVSDSHRASESSFVMVETVSQLPRGARAAFERVALVSAVTTPAGPPKRIPA